MRQIRIACCGMVVSTRPFPWPIDDDELGKIVDEIIEEIDAWRARGRNPRMWIEEEGMPRILRRWE